MAFHEHWAAVAAGGVGDEECGVDYLEEGRRWICGCFLAGVELEGEEASVEVVEGGVAF